MEMTGVWAEPICSHSELKNQYKNCQKCPLYRRRTRVVFWDGPDTAPVMAIGEAPGKDEDKQGIPFAGRAGKESLDRMLRYLGIDRRKIHISNACLCRPTDGYKNLTPTWEEINTCNDRLMTEIRLTQPKVIVTMGKPAIVAVCGVSPSSSMTSLRGWHETVYTQDGIPYTVPVMATWHPAYELRQRQMGSKKVATEMTSDWQEVLNMVPQIGVN